MLCTVNDIASGVVVFPVIVDHSIKHVGQRCEPGGMRPPLQVFPASQSSHSNWLKIEMEE